MIGESALRELRELRIRRAMARRVRRLARELELAPPFGARDFAQRLARKRVYIMIEPRRMGRQPIYGSCKPDGEYYHIYYRDDAGAILGERIIWHELGHIVLGYVTPDGREVLRRDLNSEEERLVELWAEAMEMYAGSGRTQSRANLTGLGRIIDDLGKAR